jgi:methyl-accepting chemotaxis protein
MRASLVEQEGPAMGLLRDAKVGTKLLVGFGIATAVTVSVGVFGLTRMAAVEAESSKMAEQSVPQLETMSNVNMDYALLRGAAYKHLLTTDQAKMDTYEADFAATAEGIMAHYEELAAVMAEPEGVALVGRVSDAIQLYIKDTTTLLAMHRAGDQAAADKQLIDVVAPEVTAFAEVSEELAAYVAQEAADVQAEAKAEYTSARTMSIVLILVGVAFGVAVALVIRRSIVPPLKVAVGALQAMAEGDLTQRVGYEAKDEVGQLSAALDEALDKTHAAVTDMADGAATLAAAAEELSATAHQVSASVDAVASASEEMGAAAREISVSAQQATQVATEANSLTRAAAGTVHDLGDSSASIGSVVASITEIAEQTNLLALNATIEGARAGEAGKGFAVVASEVKQLAQQTGSATEEIRSKVAGIQNSSGGVVTAIEEISRIIGTIDDSQSAIASAVEEQTVTTAEIARTITEAATGVRAITESIAAEGGVASMAAELDTIVKRFRL